MHTSNINLNVVIINTMIRFLTKKVHCVSHIQSKSEYPVTISFEITTKILKIETILMKISLHFTRYVGYTEVSSGGN